MSIPGWLLVVFLFQPYFWQDRQQDQEGNRSNVGCPILDTAIVGVVSLSSYNREFLRNVTESSRDSFPTYDTVIGSAKLSVSTHYGSQKYTYQQLVLSTVDSGIHTGMERATSRVRTNSGCYLGMTENEFLLIHGFNCLERTSDGRSQLTYRATRVKPNKYLECKRQTEYFASYTFRLGSLRRIELGFMYE